MATTKDITERQRVEEALYLNELQVHALLQLNEIAEQPMQMITDFALEKAIELTRSKIGYLAFLNADETLQTMHSWPKEPPAAGVAPQTYPVAEASRWAEAVRQRRAVIANQDAPPTSLEKGAPENVELVRYMDVPVFEGERIVAVAGMGNKETPYDENDVRQLMLLMLGVWRLVQRKQGEDRLRVTAEALRRSEAYLAEAQRLIHTGSWAGDDTLRTAYWSEELYRIYGFDPQQGLPSHDETLERIHPEDRDKVLQAFQSVIHQKVDAEVEYRIALPDGTLKYAHGIGHPVLNANGDLVEIVGTTVDITERKRTEEALARSEKLFRAIAETVPMIIILWTKYDKTDAYFNPGIYRLTGYLPEELPNVAAWWPLAYPDPVYRKSIADEWQSRIARAIATRDSIEPMEAEVTCKDGSKRYISWGFVSTGEQNISFGIDLTERKRAEEALASSEKMFRAITESSPLALILTSEIGDRKRVEYMNPTITRLFGYSLEEVESLAEWWSRAYPDPEYRKSVWDEWQFRTERAIATRGSIEPMDVEVTCKDGSKKYISWGFVSTGEQNISFGIDLTDRKRAEEALRRSEAYLAEAQRMTHTGSWADDGSIRPAYWSEELYRIFGLDPKQGVPERNQPLERIHPADRDSFLQAFDKTIHQKVDADIEFRIVLPDGTVKYAHSIGHPVLNANGELIEIVGTTVDITARKRAEEERARLHQLEADLAHINRVSIMGELTASIAHEVNQPLSGVVSNGSACLRWLAGDEPNLEEAREAARRIVRDGKRAAEIIARIRALTKRTAAHQEKLNLNEMVSQVLLLVGDEAKKRGVMIRTCFAEEFFLVVGDRVQLQQVVLNLVMNGLEAMSTITDRARELVITSRNADQDQVEVTIEDSGIGLDPDQSAKIFEAFYTTKPTGMGMGLSISRSILLAHGGRLWVTTNDGPGTTFHFSLPKETKELDA